MRDAKRAGHGHGCPAIAFPSPASSRANPSRHPRPSQNTYDGIPRFNLDKTVGVKLEAIGDASFCRYKGTRLDGEKDYYEEFFGGNARAQNVLISKTDGTNAANADGLNAMMEVRGRRQTSGLYVVITVAHGGRASALTFLLD